jgi:recombinational DNA repair protein (RecF pathway)
MVPFAFSLFLFKTDEELSAINQADWVGYYMS